MNTACSIEQTRVAMLAQKILVVDDDEDLRELLAINLRIAGYECTVAEDSFDTVNFVMDENPDLLITDLMMPKTDGY